ncbi:SpoIIE family protein phosphatase [Virgibacillus doumboii]|uniref:SpoIIE family protein phosphatase n=1 Tax=Virgibacillus doumboii TaxID=2697503 RepID=UPI0013E03312|nr:SpoIIE family protein phosphatase [Virgibacillus doumboii]
MSTVEKKVKAAVYQKPKKGEYLCGDSYFYKETDNEFICALADGLGSGEFAKESSQIVIDIIKRDYNTSVEQLIKTCNQQLTGKRGVVVGVLKIEFDKQRYTFSSIGNIGVLTIPQNGKKKRNIPDPGYLAGYHRPFKVVTENLEPAMTFIMFTDGVTDADLSQSFLLNSDVNCIAKAYEEHTDGKVRSDDTTLIAIRYEA